MCYNHAVLHMAGSYANRLNTDISHFDIKYCFFLKHRLLCMLFNVDLLRFCSDQIYVFKQMIFPGMGDIFVTVFIMFYPEVCHSLHHVRRLALKHSRWPVITEPMHMAKVAAYSQES